LSDRRGARLARQFVLARQRVQEPMMPSRPHRLPVLLAVLLAGAATSALAESPLPDPVAPAGIGRPLDQIRPGRAGKPAAKKEALRKDTAKARKIARSPAPAPQAAARPALLQGAPAAAAAPAVLDDDQPRPQRQAKRALDDRADTRVRTDDVGKGTHFARKPLGPGAYFDDKIRAAVRKYYDEHPAPGRAPQWQIGETLPTGVPVGAVPKGVLASLPKLPPGHRYVDLGGDILLVAAGSKMVVDGISARAAR
jgi:hypothetical protein